MYGWLYMTCSLLLCALLLDWCLGLRKRRLLGNLPTYPRLPLIGNLYKFFGNFEHNIYNTLEDISKLSDKNQKPFVFWAGSASPIVFLHDPEMVKTITNSFVEKPYHYSFAKVWVGDGLVTAPGNVWKRNIKKLAGTFTGSIVEGYQDVFNAQAQKLVNKLKMEIGKEPFDVMEKYLAFTTLETICQTALGVPSISETIVTKDYYEAFNKTLLLLLRRAINVFLYPDFLYKLSSGYKEILKNVSVLHNVSDTVMKLRKVEREELKRKGVIENAKTIDGKAKFKSYYDILSDMMETDHTFTEKQIKNEVDTIILGGQETVATSLQYILLMIGCKPDIQSRLHTEMEGIFGDSKRPVTKQDLSRMEYCEAVVNEALRLFPPVPGVIRLADQDLEFKSCTIPRGALCLINIFGAGRCESLWGSDATEFKPERWMHGATANQAGFYAFSYGKRACIGKKYAMAILKTILAYCTRELVIQSEAERLKLKIDLALKPASGHRIQVFLRK